MEKQKCHVLYPPELKVPPMEYYNLLGVPVFASYKDISRAFRNKSLEFHPDRGGDIKIYHKIQEAGLVLRDAEKRAWYDKYGLGERKIICFCPKNLRRTHCWNLFL